MTDHYTGALSKSSAAVHLVEIHSEIPYVDINGQHFKRGRQFHNQNTSDKMVYLNPSTTIPSIQQEILLMLTLSMMAKFID